jgi:hypothetical protein
MIITNAVKKLVLLALLSAMVLIPVIAQDKSLRDDFWACPVFESNWYGILKPAFGGGAALG